MRLLTLISMLKDKIHKQLSPLSHARKIGVRFGKGCRFLSVDFGSEPYLITLGDHVSITQAHFITHDGALWVFRDKDPDADLFAPIQVGNNVFIGMGTIILPGVSIGDNVIIGAHSLVNKDIPSGLIAAGVPAKPLGPIEAYWEKVQAQTVPTKRMAATEKRQYLTGRFMRGSTRDTGKATS